MKEESEGRVERLAEALAVESRCLLALLRMGYTLSQAEEALAGEEFNRQCLGCRESIAPGHTPA